MSRFRAIPTQIGDLGKSWETNSNTIIIVQPRVQCLNAVYMIFEPLLTGWPSGNNVISPIARRESGGEQVVYGRSSDLHIKGRRRTSVM